MKKLIYNLLYPLILVLASSSAYAQNGTVLSLWPDGAPGANPNGGEEKVRVYEPTGDHIVSNIHTPSITLFLPATGTSAGIAMIIAPGGGHRELWIDHEGYNVAKRLNEEGIAAFVLKYRLAEEENSTYSVDEHAVKDMLRAIRLVRGQASEWNIATDKIGVMGFSAGGEVAAMADLNSDDGNPDAEDPIERISSRPNFQALIYPGRSNRIVPSAQSSPVFILCGYHDRDDISKGMASLYLRFKELNIPAELHIYATAGHGFGIRQGDMGASSKWPDALIAWLNDINSGGKN